MEAEFDIKTLFIGLGFLVSLFSLALAYSAKKESKETTLLELVHQKRMLLSTQFTDVATIVRSLRNVEFENPDQESAYKRLEEFRNKMIQEMNNSSELLIDPKTLTKQRLLNEISDFNLMHAIYREDIDDLKNLIEKSKNG